MKDKLAALALAGLPVMTGATSQAPAPGHVARVAYTKPAPAKVPSILTDPSISKELMALVIGIQKEVPHDELVPLANDLLQRATFDRFIYPSKSNEHVVVHADHGSDHFLLVMDTKASTVAIFRTDMILNNHGKKTMNVERADVFATYPITQLQQNDIYEAAANFYRTWSRAHPHRMTPHAQGMTA